MTDETPHNGAPEGSPAKTHGLSFITPRATQRSMAARSLGYTRWVARLRVLLPLAAVLMIVALFVWPWLTAQKITTAVMNNLPDLVVDNLHFTGLDNQNQPYSISAVKATRVAHEGGQYDLDHPEGEITLSSGAWVAGKAQIGRMDEGTHHLWLGGNVQLFHDAGMQFTTDEAQVDMQERTAWGSKPVLIQGNFGEIRGQGFHLLESGSAIVIKGPAKAVLVPRSSAAAKPTPDLHTATPSDKPVTVHTGKQ